VSSGSREKESKDASFIDTPKHLKLMAELPGKWLKTTTAGEPWWAILAYVVQYDGQLLVPCSHATCVMHTSLA
jgi:hypothetical protein